jgi:hypothetical protein
MNFGWILAGGVALYFLYQMSGQTATPAAPAAGGGGKTNGGAAPVGTEPTQASVTAAKLVAAVGSAAMRDPDTWNWAVVNVVGVPAFNLDKYFGSIGTQARAATYSADDFLAIANGAKTPAGLNQPVVTRQPGDITKTPPPSQPATLAEAALLKAAGGSVQNEVQLNPDQWNWYVQNSLNLGAVDLDSKFGSVGTTARGQNYSAGEFVAIATGTIKVPGLSGLGRRRSPYLLYGGWMA